MAHKITNGTSNLLQSSTTGELQASRSSRQSDQWAQEDCSLLRRSSINSNKRDYTHRGYSKRTSNLSKQLQKSKQTRNEAIAKPTARISTLEFLCLFAILIVVVAQTVVYLWPMPSNLEIEPRSIDRRPRPAFVGSLAWNDELNKAELLFRDEFHAPESMAWQRDAKVFYTGVEGGFILRVEPRLNRWHIVARLNANESVSDESDDLVSELSWDAASLKYKQINQAPKPTKSADKSKRFAPFCTRDIQLYGSKAQSDPSVVYISRCSRPLGIRLSPDERYLYTMDPLSGLYRIDLIHPSDSGLFNDNNRGKLVDNSTRVTKLIDLTQWNQQRAQTQLEAEQRILFGDDIAVEWSANANNDHDNDVMPAQARNDRIFITDCSQRWTLRYLFWLIVENDSSGRVLVYETGSRRLRPLENVTPVQVVDNDLSDDPAAAKSSSDSNIVTPYWDNRHLSFPNGLELTSNKSALLISDLNNRRVIMYHIEPLSGGSSSDSSRLTSGDNSSNIFSATNNSTNPADTRSGNKNNHNPLAGTSRHLLWLPGFPDNIRRGLDMPDGRATYWAACGCAVNDGLSWFEFTDVSNGWHSLRKLGVKWLHVCGKTIEWLGERIMTWLVVSDGNNDDDDRWSLRLSRAMIDFGTALSAGWLKRDPYCSHGIVIQFDEYGKILRALHSPDRWSNFKLLSEAHQVNHANYGPSSKKEDEHLEIKSSNVSAVASRFGALTKRSDLYLGSVYYSYLGHLELSHDDGGGA